MGFRGEKRVYSEQPARRGPREEQDPAMACLITHFKYTSPPRLSVLTHLKGKVTFKNFRVPPLARETKRIERRIDSPQQEWQAVREQRAGRDGDRCRDRLLGVTLAPLAFHSSK
ncbi:hypothetical protein Baya_15526 [Bagarius yarrelli]|uniref:Uncharacterized protein n=1 Tax=Bagarius yarrelli TaxID=175774 RepID=A0A556VBZ3_BAGYA|nr:hypothetical protein Baya_15526 [Bagarius yarrelli]